MSTHLVISFHGLVLLYFQIIPQNSKEAEACCVVVHDDASPDHTGEISDERVVKDIDQFDRLRQNTVDLSKLPRDLKGNVKMIGGESNDWSGFVDALYETNKNKGVSSERIQQIVDAKLSNKVNSYISPDVHEISIDKEYTENPSREDLIDAIINDPSTPEITAESLIDIEEIKGQSGIVQDITDQESQSENINNILNLSSPSDTSDDPPIVNGHNVHVVHIDKEYEGESSMQDVIEAIINDPSTPDITSETLTHIEEILDQSADAENTGTNIDNKETVAGIGPEILSEDINDFVEPSIARDGSHNSPTGTNHEVHIIHTDKDIKGESGMEYLIQEIINDPSSPEITAESLLNVEEISEGSTNSANIVSDSLPGNDISPDTHVLNIHQEINGESSLEEVIQEIIKDPNSPEITAESLIKVEEISKESPNSVKTDSDSLPANEVNSGAHVLHIDHELNGESSIDEVRQEIIKDPTAPEITAETIINVKKISEGHQDLANVVSDSTADNEVSPGTHVLHIDHELKGEAGMEEMRQAIIKDPSSPEITAESLIKIEEISNGSPNPEQIAPDSLPGTDISSDTHVLHIDHELNGESGMDEVKQEIIKDPSTPEITAESLIKIEEITNGSPNPEQIAPDSLPGTDISSDTHVLLIDHELNGQSGMEEVKQEIINDPSTPEITAESLIKIEKISHGSPNPGQIAPDSLPGTDISSDTHVLHIDHELNGGSGMEEVKQEIINDPSTPEITAESLIKIEEISNGSPNPEQIGPDLLPGADPSSDTHVLHIDHELNGESGMEEVKQEIIKDPSSPEITAESLIKIEEISHGSLNPEQIAPDSLPGTDISSDTHVLHIDHELNSESGIEEVKQEIIKDPSSPEITAESLIKIEEISHGSPNPEQIAPDSLPGTDISSDTHVLHIDHELNGESGMEEVKQEIIKDPSSPEITAESLIKIEEISHGSPNPEQIALDSLPGTDISSDTHVLHIDHELNGQSGMEEVKKEIIKDPSSPEITAESLINIDKISGLSVGSNQPISGIKTINGEPIDKEIVAKSGSEADLLDAIYKMVDEQGHSKSSVHKIVSISEGIEPLENVGTISDQHVLPDTQDANISNDISSDTEDVANTVDPNTLF